MNSLLLFLLKSTLSLSLLYIAYRLLMHRETFFKLNRTVLLLAVLYSMTIPFLYSPKLLTVQPELKPVFQHVNISEEPIQVLDEPVTVPQSPQPILVRETMRPVTLSASAIFTIVYLTGVFISLVLLVYSINRVLLLFRKARQTNLNGIRLMVVAEDIPTFSFGRNILISQQDYENNFEAIITHEQSHIRLGHFYDLMLMELVKITFWFNPLVYRIVRDLKEIHEFQADDQALNSGIDATKYQLLIIQKSVGHQKFALANSFNHCQIKNRIAMMNKQKTGKSWRWKVATFLPLLALLLMAFGKPGENVPPEKSRSTETVSPITQDTAQRVKEGVKFTPPPLFIDIKKEGIYLMKKLVTFDELKKQLPEVVRKNPQSEVWVNIMDSNNLELPAVRAIINNECDSRKVKYIRFTQKFTPPAISEIRIPKRNTFSMQVDARGKVFVGFDGEDNMRKLLTRMGEDYNIVFSPMELEEFSNIESFGVPMNRIKAFLKMPAEERRKPENAIGIPYDSGNNEFKNWVRAARTVNKDMHITIKSDQATSYRVIDQLIGTLRDLHENRYYLALPEWTTAYEIVMPAKEKPGEQTGAVKKFTQSAVLEIAKSRPKVVTIIPDRDNSVYYYLGTRDEKRGIDPVLTKTDFSPSGIHDLLIGMNHDVLAKVEALRKKKEKGELSAEDFDRQRNEILGDKTAAIVLIKPTDASTYGSLMNILYEMVICSIGRYAIIDLSDYDKKLINKARL